MSAIIFTFLFSKSISILHADLFCNFEIVFWLIVLVSNDIDLIKSGQIYNHIGMFFVRAYSRFRRHANATTVQSRFPRQMKLNPRAAEIFPFLLDYREIIER